MTPNNIVNMAKLLGLSAIALTDHNTSLNCDAAMKVGKQVGICVIPGMELTTSEEIHVVCLFPTLEKALEFNSYVENHQMKIKNRPDIYGRQVIMNENDEETGEIENLLILATDISVTSVKSIVESFGGIAYPAHIDRESMSILAVLGEIDESYDFKTAELADKSQLDSLLSAHPILEKMNIVTNSDAHYLENMKEAQNYFELSEITPQSIIDRLSKKTS